MNAAVETARQAFPRFIKHSKSMSGDAVSVEFGLPTAAGGLEQIWFEPVTITDMQAGLCSNDSLGVADFKMGDHRTLDGSRVSDWLIAAGGEYVLRRRYDSGAFTDGA